MEEKRKNQKTLGKIVNMVTYNDIRDLPELFIATSDGEFGRFRLGESSPRDGKIVYEPLSLGEYLSQTQNYIKNYENRVNYGSKSSEEDA